MFHAWHQGPGQAHDRREVHLNVEVPDLVLNFVNGLRGVDAGVVDEDVNLAHGLLRIPGQMVHRSAVGHVGNAPVYRRGQSSPDLGSCGGELIRVAA